MNVYNLSKIPKIFFFEQRAKRVRQGKRGKTRNIRCLKLLIGKLFLNISLESAQYSVENDCTLLKRQDACPCHQRIGDVCCQRMTS